MKTTQRVGNRIKLAAGIVSLATLMGCVGYVSDDYGGPVYVPGPDVYFYGGDYDRGREVHDYSHRGFESRAVAHPAPRAPERNAAPARGGAEERR